MPARRALTAVRHRGPNVRTHIPGARELRPSPSFSRRPAGYTRTLTGLVPPQGQGCSSLLGKGVRFRRRRRGQGDALCIPPPRRGQTPPTIPFPQQPRLGGSGGWEPGEPGLRSAETEGSDRQPHHRAVCAGAGSPAGGRQDPLLCSRGAPIPTAQVTLPVLSAPSLRPRPAAHCLLGFVVPGAGLARPELGCVCVFPGPLWRPGPRDLIPEGPLDLGLALRSQATAPEFRPRGTLLLGLVVLARVRAWVGPGGAGGGGGICGGGVVPPQPSPA